MKKEFAVVITQDVEGIYIAEVPELPGCHTQARSMDILLERIKEAIDLYLEVSNAEKSEQIKIFIGVQNVSLV